MKVLYLLLLFSCFVYTRTADEDDFQRDGEQSENLIGTADEYEAEAEESHESGSGSGTASPEEDEEEEEDQATDRMKRTDEEDLVTETGSGASSLTTSNTTDEGSAKKTEINNGQRAKSLTSNTEVSVPAGVLAKVFGNNNNSASLRSGAPDQSVASNVEKGSSETTISAPVDEENTISAEKRTKLKPKPIGPMETLEIKLEGKASTMHNFTKGSTTSGDELKMPQQHKIEGNNVVRKSVTTNKKHPSKKRKSSHKKSTKNNKKNKIGFPKIILYQGPLSKAIEKMLVSKTSSERKRSEIEKMFRAAKSSEKEKVHEVDGNYEDGSEDEEEPFVYGNKKSAVVSEKKYQMKGFIDNVKVGSKQSKTVYEEGNRDQGYLDKRHKPSVIENDEIMRQHLNSMIMKDSSPYTRTSRTLPVTSKTSSKTNRINKKKKKKSPKKFVATGLPLLNTKGKANGEDETEPSGDDDEHDDKNKDDVSSGEDDKDEDHAKNGKDGQENAKDSKERDDEDDDDVNDDGSSENDDFTIGMPGHNPNEPKPEPVKEVPPTLPEETDPSNVPISPTGAPDSGLPEPVQNLPPTEDESTQPQDVPQVGPAQLSKPLHKLPLVIAANPPEGSPEIPQQLPEPKEDNLDLLKQPNEEQNYFQDDLMAQMDSNSQSIETLATRVGDLESKEKELESAMGSISEGLERIEKKLDSQQHKQSISSFNNFNPKTMQQGHSSMVPVGQLGVTTLLPSKDGSNKPTIVFDVLKKLYDTFSLPRIENNKQVHRRPKILKQIFIPLPQKGSSQAQAIEDGKIFNSPVLSRLPLPIRQIVSSIFKQQLKKEEDRGVMTDSSQNASEEPDEPAKEHDLDKLELQLGRIPISRHGTLQQQMPKLMFFASKAPRFMEMIAKPCHKPCLNGGRCLGNNVCRCHHGFKGAQCQHRIRPTIVEIIGPSPIQQLFKQQANRNSHQMALPFTPVESSDGDSDNNNDDDDSKQTVMGHVDQSKLVNILRKFTLPFQQQSAAPEVEEESDNNYFGAPFKRHHIPRGYDETPRYNRYNNRNSKDGYFPFY